MICKNNSKIIFMANYVNPLCVSKPDTIAKDFEWRHFALLSGVQIKHVIVNMSNAIKEIILSVYDEETEGKKGVNAVHRCSVENHKGSNAGDFVQR